MSAVVKRLRGPRSGPCLSPGAVPLFSGHTLTGNNRSADPVTGHWQLMADKGTKVNQHRFISNRLA